MKLYTFDSAPNPARLKMFIDYKGIEIDTVQIDMGKAAQLEADYTEIVPEATLPALVLDDGRRLTEVIAIAHYLEGLHPDRPLLGTSNEEKASIRLCGLFFVSSMPKRDAKMRWLSLSLNMVFIFRYKVEVIAGYGH